MISSSVVPYETSAQHYEAVYILIAGQISMFAIQCYWNGTGNLGSTKKNQPIDTKTNTPESLWWQRWCIHSTFQLAILAAGGIQWGTAVGLVEVSTWTRPLALAWWKQHDTYIDDICGPSLIGQEDYALKV